jgi:hypothetical protein
VGRLCLSASIVHLRNDTTGFDGIWIYRSKLKLPNKLNFSLYLSDIKLIDLYIYIYIHIKANVSEGVSEYVCVFLGCGGVSFGVRPVAIINKIKYITCC